VAARSLHRSKQLTGVAQDCRSTGASRRCPGCADCGECGRGQWDQFRTTRAHGAGTTVGVARTARAAAALDPAITIWPHRARLNVTCGDVSCGGVTWGESAQVEARTRRVTLLAREELVRGRGCHVAAHLAEAAVPSFGIAAALVDGRLRASRRRTDPAFVKGERRSTRGVRGMATECARAGFGSRDSRRCVCTRRHCLAIELKRDSMEGCLHE